MNSKLPNFLVVGSTKAGTTSIYNYLQQHASIFLNKEIKESNFFVEPKSVLGCGPRFCGEDSYGKSIEDYVKLFKLVDINKHKSIGEVCTTYIHFSKYTIPNIKKYLGDPKIIIILRNPIERAFSYYMHNMRDGDESLCFEEAIENEGQRIKDNLWLSFRLKTLGLYSKDVENYKGSFSNVKIIIYEDMKDDMQGAMNEIFDFLNIEKIKINTKEKYNISGIPKNRLLHDIIHGHNLFGMIFLKISYKLLNRNKIKNFQNYIDKDNLVKLKMNESVRKKLEKYFYYDVKILSSLLNINLNNKWKIKEK